MPLIEKRVLQSEMTLGNDSGTYILKLPKKGALFSLEIVLQWTTGATNGVGVDIFDAFDNIEIRGNGSYQIFNMTAREAFHWAWLHDRKCPYIFRSQGPADANHVLLTIPFGLPRFNRQHFLPLDMWNDVELRISYSPTIAATAGFATGTGRVAVRSWIQEDNQGLGFAGYLRNRTIYTFTAAASGIEKIDIDGHFPVPAFMVYAHEAGIEPSTSISQIDLKLNNGARTHFSDLFLNAQERNMADWMIDGSWAERIFGSDTDTINLLCEPAVTPVLAPIQGAPTIGTTVIPHFRSLIYSGNQITLSAFNDTANGAATAQVAFTTDIDVHLEALATRFPRAAVIDLGYPDMLDRALIPQMYDQVHLELTNGNAGADVRVSQLEIAQPEG